MASLATTAPAMHRLFTRLDSAPRPRAEHLRLVLAEWTVRRGKRIAPSIEDMDEVLTAGTVRGLFVFERNTAGRDFTLRRGEEAIDLLFGSLKPGGALSALPSRRSAVRLRRLFELVCETGEPLLAEFMVRSVERGVENAEVVVLPLSDDGRHVSGVIAGLQRRSVKEVPFHGVSRSCVSDPLIFAFERDASFGKAVAGHLGVRLSPLEERDFEDGEHKTRPLCSVRGRDVYIVASLYGSEDASVNDRLCRLLFFIGALKTDGAGRVTAVTPYLCYLRKDRQTKSRDPITSRYLSQLIEAVGCDGIMSIEAHNFAAFQNAFRIPGIHLNANALFTDYFIQQADRNKEFAVVSPDLGGAKRAESFREELEARLGKAVAKGFMDKQRSMGCVTGEIFAGDVSGRHVLVVDDLISSGTTMARVAAVCKEKGASEISLIATHGLFSQGASEKLADPAISRIIVTDSVPADRLTGPAAERLVVISVAGLFAEAIRRHHGNGSIVELLEN